MTDTEVSIRPIIWELRPMATTLNATNILSGHDLSHSDINSAPEKLSAIATVSNNNYSNPSNS